MNKVTSNVSNSFLTKFILTQDQVEQLEQNISSIIEKLRLPSDKREQLIAGLVYKIEEFRRVDVFSPPLSNSELKNKTKKIETAGNKLISAIANIPPAELAKVFRGSHRVLEESLSLSKLKRENDVDASIKKYKGEDLNKPIFDALSPLFYELEYGVYQKRVLDCLANILINLSNEQAPNLNSGHGMHKRSEHLRQLIINVGILYSFAGGKVSLSINSHFVKLVTEVRRFAESDVDKNDITIDETREFIRSITERKNCLLSKELKNLISQGENSQK